MDVRTGRVLLKAPFWPDALGRGADGGLLGVGVGPWQSMTAADKHPRSVQHPVGAKTVARIVRGAIWGQSPSQVQPFDRTGKVLGSALPGEVHVMSDRWLITASTGTYNLYEIS